MNAKTTTSFTPKTDDRVWLEDGQEAVFVATQGGEHIVRPLQVIEHIDDADEEYLGRPITVEAIYPAAPTPKFEARVQELQIEIAGLEAVRDNLDSEIEERKRQEQARLVKLKSHEALARIEDYLDGKISHIVVKRYYSDVISIIDVKSADMHAGDDDNRYASVKKPKLMTLFGDEKKALQWGLSYYSTGSGSDSHWAWPFCSYEEAQAHAGKMIDEMIVKVRKEGHGHERLIESLKACGLPVPDDILDASTKKNIEYAESAIAEAQKALTTAQAKHAALINPAP